MDYQIYSLFADVFAYPTRDLSESIRRLKTLLSPQEEAVKKLDALERLVTGISVQRLQEIYSGVFELDASLHPYVGHHIFGESYKRSLFMVGLKGQYKEVGLNADFDLPDHLFWILRFLSVNGDSAFASELVHEALLPALEKMLRKKGEEEETEKGEEGTDVGRMEAPSLPRVVPSGAVAAWRCALEALRMVLSSTPRLEYAASAEDRVIDTPASFAV